MAYDPSDFDQDTNLDLAIPPISSVDWDKDEDVIKYAFDTFETLEDEATSRRDWQRDNLCRYKGFYSQYEPVVGGAGKLNSGVQRNKWPRIVINHTRDLVDKKVAKSTKVKVTSDVLPTNDEGADKIASQVAKKVLTTVDYAHDAEGMRARLARRAIIFGEAYEGVFWDEDAGDVDPDYVTKTKKGEDIPELDERDQPVMDADGNITYVSILPRVGDVRRRLIENDDILLIPGPRPSLDSVPGCIIKEYIHVFELRAKYPDLASKIEASNDLSRFNVNTLEDTVMKEHVLVLHFYFKTSRLLPKGLYFSVCHDTLLEEVQPNPIPYSRLLDNCETGNLPFSRITDIDIEGSLHGWSSMHDLNTIQNQYDKITSLISRNIFLFCHPKWIVPRGGASYTQLANGSFIVESSGPFQPTLATYTAVTQEVFAYWEALEAKMEKIFSIFQISRGESPTGARSASQLMIYDEQEEESRLPFRKKLEHHVTSIDSKTLAIISHKYTDEDERLIQIVGENKDWLIEPFEVEDLRKDYVIRVRPINGLPEAKYPRIRTLIELQQMSAASPEGPLMSRDEFLEAIDYGQHEKFISYGRMAVLTAQAENELLLKGDDIDPSQRYEELITHWRTHAKLFQGFGFRKLPKEWQENAKKHMLGTEMQMYVHAADNPTFKAQLFGLTSFPMFYEQPPIVGPSMGMPDTATPPAPMGAPQQSKPQGPPPASPSPMLQPEGA